VRQIADGVAATYGVTANLELIQGGYMPVENAPEQTADLIDFMSSNPRIDYAEVPPAMTGEDFGFMLHQFPGAMVWLGVGDPAHPLHSSKMSPDEAALVPGVYALSRFLEQRMNVKK
jgi:N-acetyldiaminopimelate deacetylase